MNNIEHIGTFSLGNKVMVSDPCYKLSTWCQGVLKNVKSGIWDAYLKMSDEGVWGIRVAELITVNSEHHKEHPVIMDEYSTIISEYQEFEVGVDSGCAGIFDYDYYAKYHTEDENDEKWYETRIINQFFPTHNSYGWKRSIFTDSEGVASNSGYGDGGYNCYVARNAEGEIVGIKIVYISKEDDD